MKKAATRVVSRARVTLRTAEECLVLIVEWFRDELVHLTSISAPATASGDPA